MYIKHRQISCLAHLSSTNALTPKHLLSQASIREENLESAEKQRAEEEVPPFGAAHSTNPNSSAEAQHAVKYRKGCAHAADPL